MTKFDLEDLRRRWRSTPVERMAASRETSPTPERAMAPAEEAARHFTALESLLAQRSSTRLAKPIANACAFVRDALARRDVEAALAATARLEMLLAAALVSDAHTESQ